MAEELKLKGNEAFQASDFSSAEEYYKKAIEIDQTSHILYTNLAAALLEQNKIEEAIEASNQAILINPTWLKAYFRKASAYDSLEKYHDSFLTWTEALKFCENTVWLKKQYEKSKGKWLTIFKTTPVTNSFDLLDRYRLLNDSREKLSTLAHFWNLSTPEERLKHFLFFLTMIGGQTPSPESIRNTHVEMMQEMPMHNYPDLPLENIPSWCEFFQNLDSDSKTHLLEQFWYTLSSKEQNDVVVDLQLFMSQARQLLDQQNETVVVHE